MTNSEAIKILNTVLFFGKCDLPNEHAKECLKTAIQALEKQIPKKPCYTFSEDEEILASCEICDSNIDWTYQGHWRKGQPKYCRNCGQKIDWSDEE